MMMMVVVGMVVMMNGQMGVTKSLLWGCWLVFTSRSATQRLTGILLHLLVVLLGNIISSILAELSRYTNRTPKHTTHRYTIDDMAKHW
jgi:formate/nitrite transporter FocA (FNT family)